MSKEPITPHYGTMTRNELAELYLPHVQLATARRTFHRWIARSSALQAELAKVGYSIHTPLLTPAQVELIFKYIGVP